MPVRRRVRVITDRSRVDINHHALCFLRFNFGRVGICGFVVCFSGIHRGIFLFGKVRRSRSGCLSGLTFLVFGLVCII